MKRVAIITFCVALVFLAVFIFVELAPSDPNAPRLEQAQPPVAVQRLGYDFLTPRPFEGGKMWINASTDGTNLEAFFFDIDSRKVLGKMKNGWPDIMSADQSLLLCSRLLKVQRKPIDHVRELMEKLSGGRFKYRPGPREIIRFWLLDLRRNAATIMGDIPGIPNFMTVPSPGFRYAYTGRHNDRGQVDFFCFDVLRRSIRKLNTQDWASGWWDASHILLQTTNADFLLYDVRTGAASPFINLRQIASLLLTNSVSEDPKLARAFFIWNGHEYDFYLTDAHQKWLAEESFLIKVERPDGKLRLLSLRFKFEWSDHFDATGRYYLYSGRGAGNASDGVFLRDLQRGTNVVLIAPDSETYFSLPRFYGDSAIYFRSNVLWRINLDGSGNTRLFPPEAVVGSTRQDGQRF